ncbi:uncharacterized protein LOC115894748 [Rhinopithecus roxellana]|uniref:uncharacterized protein LOC115894748 n=1 Tax=Rhinopithecus roxellana TaxID=61622 RepID=UPI001237449F|nr:uncharacterized protein LOC115894748 [Rhinopithecus roxellana]
MGVDTVPSASQRRKLRLREVHQCAHDHTTSEWQSEDLSPRPVLFSAVLVTWSPEAPLNRNQHPQQPYSGPWCRAWPKSPLAFRSPSSFLPMPSPSSDHPLAVGRGLPLPPFPRVSPAEPCGLSPHTPLWIQKNHKCCLLCVLSPLPTVSLSHTPRPDPRPGLQAAPSCLLLGQETAIPSQLGDFQAGNSNSSARKRLQQGQEHRDRGGNWRERERKSLCLPLSAQLQGRETVRGQSRAGPTTGHEQAHPPWRPRTCHQPAEEAGDSRPKANIWSRTNACSRPSSGTCQLCDLRKAKAVSEPSSILKTFFTV